jgi:hypothetical protein
VRFEVLVAVTVFFLYINGDLSKAVGDIGPKMDGEG